MRFNRMFAIAMTLTLMAVGRSGASCSNATLNGGFGFGLSGTNSSGFFTASEGLLTVNGAGGVTGTQTSSNNGVITLNAAVTGTYSIGPTCSGTLTITPSGGSAQNYAVVIDSRATRVEMVETDNGFTVSGYALAQGTQTCTLAGVKGIYGYSGSGWGTSPTLFPTAYSGQSSADGLGNVKGQQTTAAGGVIVTRTSSGTYTVNPDCTGTTTTTNNKGMTSHSNVVLVNSGRSYFQIQTDAGTIDVNSGQRQ